MKWKKYYPQEGDRRTVSRFLWFPTEIEHEVRWLEKAKIIQEYKHYANLSYGWEDVKWEK